MLDGGFDGLDLSQLHKLFSEFVFGLFLIEPSSLLFSL